MADFDDVKTKIRKLIEEQYSPSSSDLKDIIEYLSLYMKREEKSKAEGGIAHEPIYNSDFPPENDRTSVLERANWRADLDAGDDALDFDSLLRNSDNDGRFGDEGIWNESVKALIQKYRDYFFDINEEAGITVSGTDKDGNTVSRNFYIVRNILKANAGNHFKKVGSNWWTLPFWNIDGDSYNTVRGTDQIEQVLTSSKNMDFTHTQEQADVESLTNDESPVKKYIRLLMPRYTRRVEVEDLNRNFWVIGQVLSIVCADLFDKDGLISQMFKSLASETLQLWENVLYLWAAVELLNEKKGETPEPETIPYNSTNTVFQVIDLPRAQDKPYRDINEFVNEYENWVESDNKGGVRGKLRQFEKIYPNKHLAFLIRCRIGNYEKDYYHTEIYPYIAFFDANAHQGADSWHCVKLCNYQKNVEHEYEQPHKKWPFGITLRIDSSMDDGTTDHYFPNNLYRVQNLRGRVYGIREEGISNPNKYYFYWPFSDLTPHDNYKQPNGNIKPTKTGDPGGNNVYRAIVRIKPTISSGYSDTASENTQIRVKIEFKIEDVARKLHWLTQASEGAGETASAQYDRYKDYKGKDGISHNPEWNIKKTTEKTIKDNGTTNREITIDIDNGWGEWGYEYDNNSNPHGVAIYNDDTHTNPGFTINFRDSGFQGSLCDMITYRGITKS